ncbi:LytR family transcriptional regulator [Bacillus sp. CGMCC 1.16541]|uniref:LytR family transcriptional regulator n=1 Tax=Bacillus sp. CGMCC 1.16541 TaxID=2185143 RepID=UPI000D733E6D|nr:LytR family transcriptional regulator [Bacillus sp. CGMCC 1.16541]
MRYTIQQSRKKEFDLLPKSVKQTIRYMKQDASPEQLLRIQKMINTTITHRLREIEGESKDRLIK